MMKPSEIMHRFDLTEREADELLRLHQFGPAKACGTSGPRQCIAYENARMAEPDSLAIHSLVRRGMVIVSVQSFMIVEDVKKIITCSIKKC